VLFFKYSILRTKINPCPGRGCREGGEV